MKNKRQKIVILIIGVLLFCACMLVPCRLRGAAIPKTASELQKIEKLKHELADYEKKNNPGAPRDGWEEVGEQFHSLMLSELDQNERIHYKESYSGYSFLLFDNPNVIRIEYAKLLIEMASLILLGIALFIFFRTDT